MKSVTRTIRIAVAVSATCALAARASVPSAEVEAAAAFAPPRLLKVSGALRQSPTTKGEAPIASGTSRRDQEIMELRRRFNAAADPVTHRMSLARARQTGWDGVAKHFSEIDQSGQGTVSFDELALYLRNQRHPAFAN